MATYASLSAPPFSSRSSFPPSVQSVTYRSIRISFFNKGLGCGLLRNLAIQVKCLASKKPSQDVEAKEADTTSSSSPSSSSDYLAYKLCAGLGAVGLLETAYLTYLKLTNSDAFCPIGGGSCGDILNSDYAVVFGTYLYLQIIGFFLLFDYLDID